MMTPPIPIEVKAAPPGAGRTDQVVMSMLTAAIAHTAVAAEFIHQAEGAPMGEAKQGLKAGAHEHALKALLMIERCHHELAGLARATETGHHPILKADGTQARPHG